MRSPRGGRSGSLKRLCTERLGSSVPDHLLVCAASVEDVGGAGGPAPPSPSSAS